MSATRQSPASERAGAGRQGITQVRFCRRCLLRDMQEENDYYQSVVKYRARLPLRVRTPDAAYERRLSACETCDDLQNGTCMQCGCYVEMRAARRDRECPLGRWLNEEAHTVSRAGAQSG